MKQTFDLKGGEKLTNKHDSISYLEKENESLEKIVYGYEESYATVLDYIHEEGLTDSFKKYLLDRRHSSPERCISMETYMNFVECLDDKIKEMNK